MNLMTPLSFAAIVGRKQVVQATRERPRTRHRLNKGVNA